MYALESVQLDNRNKNVITQLISHIWSSKLIWLQKFLSVLRQKVFQNVFYTNKVHNTHLNRRKIKLTICGYSYKNDFGCFSEGINPG